MTETITEHKTVFDVKDMNLWYGNTQALKNLNLEIPENQVTAIIGPSGCGKSTFIKTLNLMITRVPGVHMSGDILFNSQNILKDRIDLVNLRKQIGMIFQKGNPFPQSVYDNVAYGPRIHGVKKKKQLDEIVESSLKDVALWDEVKDRLNSSALGLSGGQQQRLCIARTIATKPRVVLMDEPTSALDPVSTLRIEQLISELKNQYTIVIVTHNMQQAARISDQTAFFLHGEIIESTDTGSLFSVPVDRRTEDYISGRFG
ncbi:phosphate ABC transporter ATP-binding protein PstB [Sediminibacillus albus]|uniref:Phosphate transport system ATP-binding protein n=1 Tax=Sediminibacillus albus TaxID=407036 RepID=A0A1G9CSP1_9BACI|nr:phosphate ABC transporter ATP-binding protein PstB [Sediminibacillus albus]SDK54649.1 phosphate transport system ATP-binding protein [Sediminibacillus albus]